MPVEDLREDGIRALSGGDFVEGGGPVDPPVGGDDENSANFVGTDNYLDGFEGNLTDEQITINYWMKIVPPLTESQPFPASIAPLFSGDGGGGPFSTVSLVARNERTNINTSEIFLVTVAGSVDVEVLDENDLYNKWLMLTLVSRNTEEEVDLYLNGKLIERVVGTKLQGLAFDLLGEDLSGFGDNLVINRAKYSDIAVWNVGLSPAQITTLYNEGNYYNPQDIAGVIHHYNFNSSEGTTTSFVPDLVGSRDLSVIDSGTGLASTFTLDTDVVPSMGGIPSGNVFGLLSTQSVNLIDTNTALTGFGGNLTDTDAQEDYAIEYWIKAEPLVANESNDPQDAVILLAGESGGDPYATRVAIYKEVGGDYRLEVRGANTESLGTAIIANAETVLFDGNWHQILISSSFFKVNVYLDNNLLLEDTSQSRFLQNNSYELLGADVSGGGANINQKIKIGHIAVYERDFPAGNFLFTDGVYRTPPNSPNEAVNSLMHYYNFEEQQGLTTGLVPDLIGNKDLTPINTATGLAATLVIDNDHVPNVGE